MFLYHGAEDSLLPMKSSLASYEYLRNKVYKGSENIQFIVEDDLKHEISEKELNQVGLFLHKVTKQKQKVELKE